MNVLAVGASAGGKRYEHAARDSKAIESKIQLLASNNARDSLTLCASVCEKKATSSAKSCFTRPSLLPHSLCCRSFSLFFLLPCLHRRKVRAHCLLQACYKLILPARPVLNPLFALPRDDRPRARCPLSCSAHSFRSRPTTGKAKCEHIEQHTRHK